MNYYLKRMLEKTYQSRRVFDADYAIVEAHWAGDSSEATKKQARKAERDSVLTMMFGVQKKFKAETVVIPQARVGTIARDVVVPRLDRNAYNWLEQLLLPVTAVKNMAKFVVEGLFYMGSDFLSDVGKEFWVARTRARALKARGQEFLWGAIAVFAYTLASPLWLVSKISQSVMSPFAGINETYEAVTKLTKFRALGVLAAIARGLFSVSAWTVLGIFVAPLAVASMASAGAVGNSIASGLIAATNWIGNLPVIHTIGAYFASAAGSVASVFGITMTETVASAATIAGAFISTSIVASALKALVRRLSPFKDKFELKGALANTQEVPAKDSGVANFVEADKNLAANKTHRAFLEKTAKPMPVTPYVPRATGSSMKPSGKKTRQTPVTQTTVTQTTVPQAVPVASGASAGASRFVMSPLPATAPMNVMSPHSALSPLSPTATTAAAPTQVGVQKQTITTSIKTASINDALAARSPSNVVSLHNLHSFEGKQASPAPTAPTHASSVVESKAAAPGVSGAASSPHALRSPSASPTASFHHRSPALDLAAERKEDDAPAVSAGPVM